MHSLSCRSSLARRVVAVALVTASAPLSAQQRDTVKLAELVVTADRAPTPAGKSVATTTVITGEQLRQQGIYFVGEALKSVPSAAVVSSGSYGGITSLFLRGGESDYVKVLIDGVPANQDGGGFNFGTLSTDNVDRIEIVRGPVSVLYGSDAVTGVVQIFTRQGTNGFRGEVSSQAGSHGSWQGQVSAGGGTRRLAASGSLSRYTTDGIYRFNSGYGSTVGSGAVTLRPDDRTDLTFTARVGDNTLHFPTDFAGVPVDSNQRSTQSSTAFGLDAGRRFGERAELRVFLASYREKDGSDNAQDSPGDTLNVFASRSRGRELRRQADVRGILEPVPGIRITTGATAEFEDLITSSQAQYNFGFGPTLSVDPTFDHTRRNLGVYSQSVLGIGPRTILNLGARLDDNQKFGTHFTYRLGAVYQLASRLRARGSVGSAFKEPSLRENYIRSAFEVGNPDLEPETTRSWEVGLEQALLNGRASVAVNYFDQRFRNLIQYNGNAAPGTPNYDNIARATSRGIEVIGDARPVPSVTVTASYTWLRTRVDDAGFSTGAGDVFVEGKPLVRRPKHSARLDAHARLADRLGLGLGAGYIGRREDVDFRGPTAVRTSLPAYLTVDADLAFDILRPAGGRLGVTATARVENLFDRSYETVVGFPGRGRAIFAGARVGL